VTRLSGRPEPEPARPSPDGPIEAVLLDVGGVFFVPHHQFLGPPIESAGGSPDEALLDRAHYAGMAAMDATGRVDWGVYKAALAVAAGVPADRVAEAVEALNGALSAANLWSRLLPGSVEGLRAIAATGVGIAIVSNSDGTVERLLSESRVCQVGAGHGVEVVAVIDSHVVGVEKPDARIFQVALEALGVRAELAVHVGDTAFADVDGARAAGVRSLHLDPFGDCPRPPGDHDHVRSLLEVAQRIKVQPRR
jgi:putative hydrolase of the HAD superfamily